MKRFAALALILSIGLFSFGCAEGKKPKDTKDTKPAAEATDGAKTDADAAKPADADKKDAAPAKK